MLWTKTIIDEFLAGTTAYIEREYVGKGLEIDCADLALAYLIDFAVERKLPVALRYYASGAWETFHLKPRAQNASSAKKYVLRMFGARNVIDNTVAIKLGEARPGDLVMSKWRSGGHTRVITKIVADSTSGDAVVTFYQGNLPPVVPVKKVQSLGAIDHGLLAADEKLRRWAFSRFNRS